MLTNLNLTVRFLKNNKLYSIINLTGLSLALTASFIILIYVINEFRFNSCHKNSKSVYRVLNYYKDFDKTISGTPYILARTLSDEFPQIEKAVNVYPVKISLNQNNEWIQVNSIGTNSEIFEIFTIPILWGERSSDILENKSSIAISQNLAERLFGNINPVGKEIHSIINNEEIVLFIECVYENMPENSTFKPDCLVNSKWTLAPINNTFKTDTADVSWSFDFWTTWIKLSRHVQVNEIDKQLSLFQKEHISPDPHNSYFLQNLKDVYLKSKNIANTGTKGNLDSVKIFSLIALIIILVATINYIVLSTAVSINRFKEIGVKKAFGVSNKVLRDQFLWESVLLVFIAFPISSMLVWFVIPFTDKLFPTSLRIINANIATYVSVSVIFLILIGVLSGLYTSQYLSKLSVINIFKNSFFFGRGRYFFWSVLIVIQLIFFTLLGTCTLIIRSQYNYAINIERGYHTKNIIHVNLGREFKGYSAFINTIRNNPNVIATTGVKEGIPMIGYTSSMFPNFNDSNKKVEVEKISVDYGFINTMGIELLDGRDFSEQFGSDLNQSVILNEEAIKQLSIDDPIGKRLGNQVIIGIVKDFNPHSIHSKIVPASIHLTNRNLRQVVIHYKEGSLSELLPFLREKWEEFAPAEDFTFTTIEELTKSLYLSDKKLLVSISIFTVLTLAIAVFGLFGLTLFVAKTRMREFGIMKIFGADHKAILLSILRKNLLLILYASVIAIPITTFIMNKWLMGFSERISIRCWMFLITITFAACIVLLTVFFSTYKTLKINPVEVLRYE